MEPFEGMSDAGIAALDHDGVEDEIDLACAREGVKLIRRPVEPEYPNIGTDVTYHRVRADVLFATVEEATAFAEVVNQAEGKRNTKYTELPGPGWNHVEVITDEPPEPPSVTQARAYSKERFNGHIDDLARRERMKAEHNKALSEYNQAQTDRNKLAEPIRERHEEACERIHYRARLQKEFEGYLVLAKNDREIAMNFLKKAWDVPEDWKPE